MSKPKVLVGFKPNDEMRGAIDGVLLPVADVVYLSDVATADRAAALSGARILLTWNLSKELSDDERRTGNLAFIQTMSAGIDHIKADAVPAGALLAHNGGAFATVMAEHVLAMALAAARALTDRHGKLAQGIFDQSLMRTLLGGTALIVGYGGIGKEVARLCRAFGMTIHAINRSGRVDEGVARAGKPSDLPAMLPAADLVVLTLSLNAETEKLFDAPMLGAMKDAAILVNVARGEVIDEDALYAHLKANPGFTACLDVWWQEPARQGSFGVRHPFFELPNLIGSPHNSGMVPGAFARSTRAAAENIRRYLETGRAERLAQPGDFL